jgi:hypothetical protein
MASVGRHKKDKKPGMVSRLLNRGKPAPVLAPLQVARKAFPYEAVVSHLDYPSKTKRFTLLLARGHNLRVGYRAYLEKELRNSLRLLQENPDEWQLLRLDRIRGVSEVVGNNSE